MTVHIGIDFDNTIVSYDGLFHRVAMEQRLVADTVPASKLAVRDHLRETGREDVWTEMQGYVYGARMDEAAAYDGVQDFLRWARASDIMVSIVSHKTRHPFLGPRYDLHAAARHWVEHHLTDAQGAMVAPERVYFELTKDEKLNRVAAIGCDWFIDDLPEILLSVAFPQNVDRILFDPEGHHGEVAGLVRLCTWSDIRRHFDQCSRQR